MLNPTTMRLAQYFVAALMLTAAASAAAQTTDSKPLLLLYHPTAALPAYEVATIKPIDPDTAGGMVKLPPGVFLSPLSIRRYIMNAYGATYAAQVIGGPDWLNKDAYNITGKASDELQAAMQNMTFAARYDQNRGMQQSLLADRFHLKAHYETRVLPVYALVPAKGGLKITEVPPPPERKLTDPPIRMRPGQPLPPGASMTEFNRNGQHVLNARAIKVALLARIVSGDVGDRPLVDNTGFTGCFDVNGLTWAPIGDAGAASATDSPSITVALEESLGLKVISTKAPIEVLVIDSIDRPTEN